MTIDLYPAPSTSWRWKLGVNQSGRYLGGLTTNYGWWSKYSILPRLHSGRMWPHAITANVTLMDSSDCSQLYFVFGSINTATSQITPIRLNGSNYTIDVSTYIRASGWRRFDLPSSLYVDVSSDVRYCFGLMANKISAGNNTVGTRTVSSEWNWQSNMLGCARYEVTTNFNTIPANLSTTFFVDQGGSTPHTHCFELDFSFNKRKLMTISPVSSTGIAIVLPTRVDAGKKTWVKFNGVYANTNQYMLASFNKTLGFSSQSTNGLSSLQTFRLDMGSTDYVSLNGSQVALNAVTPEINNQLDIAFSLDSTYLNAFWVNRTIGQGGESTLDRATFSHAAKVTGNRSTAYDAASTTTTVMYLSYDTSTITSIEIGAEMAVVLGDSQADFANVDRLGWKIANAFDAIFWDATISGGCFSKTTTGYHKAAYLRYQSTAAGNGDICDMRDILLFDAGMGLNDVSAMVSTNENKRDWTVSEIGRRLFEVFGDAKNNGNQGFILGLPPYSSTVNASMEENRVIRDQLNPAKEAIAIGCRCAFANPYNDMLDVTQNSTVFGDVFKASYCTGGDHYNSTGASIAINRLLISHNSKTVGGGWAKGFNGLVIGNVIG